MSSLDEHYDYLFKFLLVGDRSVGKSSILTRFTDNDFKEYCSATIGIDFKVRTVTMDGATIKLQIWDTAGAETYRALRESYYRGSHGVIVVYDITNKQSFENVEKWLNDVDMFTSGRARTLLVGNKCDDKENRVVKTEDAQKLADDYEITFLETSAKTAQNVEATFLKMAEEIKARVGPPIRSGSSSLRLEDLKIEQQTTCCYYY